MQSGSSVSAVQPYGLGAVIVYVYPNGTRRPIAYASRTLNGHEKRYGQIDKEALAIMFDFKRLHVYLYGRHFTNLSDLKPVEGIFGLKTAIAPLPAMRVNDGYYSCSLPLQY